MATADFSLDVCRVPGLGWLPPLPLPLRVEADATVHELGLAAEAALRAAGAAGARVSLVLNPARDGVLPPQAHIGDVFEPAIARVLVVADVPGAARATPAQGAHSHSHKAAAPATMGGGTKRADGKIPITVLTGFLGSGKTTLLNHLLHTQREQKIAVIENEFGEVPIDNELLAASKHAAAEQVIVMDNGCMCCSVRGDILGAFASILAAVEAGKPIDAVLIETTGMADPVPIVRTLLQTPVRVPPQRYRQPLPEPTPRGNSSFRGTRHTFTNYDVHAINELLIKQPPLSLTVTLRAHGPCDTAQCCVRL